MSDSFVYPSEEPKLNRKIQPFAQAYKLNERDFEYKNGRVIFKYIIITYVQESPHYTRPLDPTISNSG